MHRWEAAGEAVNRVGCRRGCSLFPISFISYMFFVLFWFPYFTSLYLFCCPLYHFFPLLRFFHLYIHSLICVFFHLHIHTIFFFSFFFLPWKLFTFEVKPRNAVAAPEERKTRGEAIFFVPRSADGGVRKGICRNCRFWGTRSAIKVF